MFARMSQAAAFNTHCNQGNQDNQRNQGGHGANCFLKGTKIRTAQREREIEDLVIGDLLPAMFGDCVQFSGSDTTGSRRPMLPSLGSMKSFQSASPVPLQVPM